MSSWWGELATALRIFYLIGIGSGVLLLFQMAMLVLGFDGDDLDADSLEGGEVSILSLRTVTAFFAGFGWTGVALLENGQSLPVATIGGLVVGSGFMASVVLLMRMLYSMRHSGTLDYSNAIGEIGKVYAPIAGAMAKPGQVEVMVQGRLMTVAAFTRGTEDLATLTRVKVTGVLDQGTLVVEALDDQAGS